jgi:hypothetical protein
MKKLIIALGLITSIALGAVTEVDKSTLGVINYIKNPAAENGIYGWNNYADAAGTTPVDCTGGSPNSALTASPSSPLAGQKSFLWTKNSGASRQGEGFSYDFTIDASKKAQPLSVSFDMTLVSGTYSTGDQTIWIYDVTNSALIQPDTYQVQAVTAGTNYKHTLNFQAASNSTSYRLCFHNSSSSNTSAYSLKYDAFKLSSEKTVQGVPSSDWTSYTPTMTGLTIGNGTLSGLYQRIGDNARIRIVMKSGTTTSYSGNFTFSFPTGIVLDTNKALTTGYGNFGTALAQINASGFKQYNGIVSYNNTTSVIVSPDGGASSTPWASNVPATWAASTANQTIDLDFLIPVVGWSSNVAMSSDSDTRVLSLASSRSGTQSISNATMTTVIFNSASKDSHSILNQSTGVVTIPIAGRYTFSGYIAYAANGTGEREVDYRIDGTGSNTTVSLQLGQATYGNYIPYTFDLDLNAGQTVEIRTYQDSTGSLNLASGSTLYVKRASGPAVIAASEKIYAAYYVNASSSNISIANSTSEVVDFNVKEYDSHGAVTTGASWVFTAPRPGQYRVTSSVLLTTGGAGRMFIDFLGGGVSKRMNESNASPAAGGASASGSYTFNLLAGQTISVRVFQGSGSAVNINYSQTDAWVVIESL